MNGIMAPLESDTGKALEARTVVLNGKVQKSVKDYILRGKITSNPQDSQESWLTGYEAHRS